MSIDRKYYLAELARYLGSKRVEHSQNVARAAREIAERFAPELADKAVLAGLLHDNAKRMAGGELMRLAAEHDIVVSAVAQRMPNLLHGEIGALLLQQRFGVADPEVAQAVADHVTGRPNMGLLSRILFVADQAAADRDFPGVEELRRSSAVDLDQAVFLAVKYKLSYVIQMNRPVEQRSIELYNSLCLKERQSAPR